MKQLSVILIAGLSVLMLACSSVTVKHDFDPEYDFLKFKTYRWASAKELNPQDELQKYPLVYKRIVSAVDKALAAKGMTKVEMILKVKLSRGLFLYLIGCLIGS